MELYITDTANYDQVKQALLNFFDMMIQSECGDNQRCIEEASKEMGMYELIIAPSGTPLPAVYEIGEKMKVENGQLGPAESGEDADLIVVQYEGIIITDTENYDALKTAGINFINYMKANQCGGDSDCEAQMDAMIGNIRPNSTQLPYVMDDDAYLHIDAENNTVEPLETGNKVTLLDLSNATNLETIEERVFYNNSYLTTVILPDNVNFTIEYGAFENCGITTLVLPNNTIYIGDNAFYINSISSLLFPTSLTYIGHSAFQDNRITGTLTIPSSVVTIGDYAFVNWNGDSGNRISSLNLSNATSLETIGDYAFDSQFLCDGNCTYYLTSILISMSESDWNSSVSLGSEWYDHDGSPTITYNAS